MYSPAIYLLAAAGIAISWAVPATAEYFDNDDYALFVREAFADYGIDFEALASLETRGDTLADSALDAAKATIPYAGSHVNIPKAPKTNFAIGLAGKIVEKIPTSQQIASSQALRQGPTGSTQIRQGMQKEEQAQSAQKASNQAALQGKLDAAKQGSKDNTEKIANAIAKTQQSKTPVQDALKAKPAKPPVPAKPAALSSPKVSQPSSSGGSGASGGKPATTKTPPPVPAKPAALKGKKLRRRALLRKRMMERLMDEGDLW